MAVGSCIRARGIHFRRGRVSLVPRLIHRVVRAVVACRIVCSAGGRVASWFVSCPSVCLWTISSCGVSRGIVSSCVATSCLRGRRIWSTWRGGLGLQLRFKVQSGLSFDPFSEDCERCVAALVYVPFLVFQPLHPQFVFQTIGNRLLGRPFV